MSYAFPLLVLALFAAGTSEFACRATPAVSQPTWVHVAEIAPLRGGMPTAISAISVSASGEIQVSRETDQDQLITLRELRGDATGLFQELGRIAGTIGPSPRHRDDDRDLVRESLPSRLRVAMGEQGPVVLWEGERDEAPSEVSRVVTLVREFSQQGVELNAPEEKVYLRASVLPPAIVRELRKEGFVRNAEPQALNRFLATAVEQPFHLIPVTSSDNPFSPFWTQFQPARGALELSVRNRVFQIRSLVHPLTP